VSYVCWICRGDMLSAALFAGGVGRVGRDGRDTPRAALYARGRGGWVLFAGGAGADPMCAALYAGGRGGEFCLLEVLEVLEVLEAMRCMLLCRYAGGCGEWAQFRRFEIMAVFCRQAFMADFSDGGSLGPIALEIAGGTLTVVDPA